MAPYDQMIGELQRLIGQSGVPSLIATVTAADGTSIDAELVSVDRFGCLVNEVRATAPTLANSGVNGLKQWADALSRRISYLLETLTLLEVDEDQNAILIRSNPPDRQGSATTYYEVMLTESGPGRVVLRRYESQRGIPGRQSTEMQLTHEVLARLTRDLIETVPP